MVAGPPRGDALGMLPAFDRTARDAAYLMLALLTSIVAFTVWVCALTLSLTFAVLVVGIPVVIGSAFVLRWTAELDRRNAALVFGRPVRGVYRSHRGSSLGRRVLAVVHDPQVWRDLGWLITHSIVGFAFGVAAVSLVASVLGLATLPAWYWALPDGQEFGLWHADTLPKALASAFLALPLAFVTAWLLRGMAKFHASLAVEFLGRR
jgi:Putative sensor